MLQYLDAAVVNSILIAAFTVLFAAILAFFVRLNRQIVELQKQMERVNTQVSPLWARVQAQIAEDLHHPDPKYAEMDGLLEKLEALTITNGDRVRLKELLVERSRDMDGNITSDQRAKATLMLTVMDMVLVEKAITKSAASMEARVVAIEKHSGGNKA